MGIGQAIMFYSVIFCRAVIKSEERHPAGPLARCQNVV